MENKDLNYVFTDMPLYTKEEFQIFDLISGKYEINNDNLEKFCKFIGVKQNKIVTYCHKCKKEFPFSVDKKYIEFEGSINEYYFLFIKKDRKSYFNIKDGEIWGNQPPYKEEEMLDNRIYYLEYIFKCTNNEEHIYFMTLAIQFKKDKFIVTKIGQNPSMITIKGYDFDKYKNILNKLDAYDEYRKADLSFANQFYVGSFAYLRRVFEKILNSYIEDDKKKEHVDEKIEATKECFDPRIRSYLSSLYKILSASIHEIKEEKSKEYYGYLKAIIDMQLEYMKTENDKEKQSQRLNSVLSQIIKENSDNNE